MAFRIERLNGEMQRSLSGIIQSKLRDPRITGMVSVTSVECAKDLKTAKVYISIFGEKDIKDETLAGIKASAGYIRKLLSEEFREIRTVPELTILIDNSSEYSENIETLLAGLNKK